MNPTDTIYQCAACGRQHDGGGAVLAFRICVPELADCGREDCISICEELLERERQRRARRHERHAAKVVTPPARSRPVQKLRPAGGSFASHSVPREDELGTGRAAQDVRQEAEARIQPLVTPSAREDEFRAAGAADSANAILYTFFCKPENFNQPFRSTDLEAMTAAGGHPTSRMNNRAIWLREKFLPEGLYLDNDPNGNAWGLPNGSYYRLCRIEEATSLSAEQKEWRLVAAGLKPDPQGEFGIGAANDQAHLPAPAGKVERNQNNQ